ncbi:MAG TPA: PilZ domain-containing protein [Acidimicrobiales bacterium]|nr:PilZ domain-containing protein [Acidimicrobiales bacterium]
MRLSSGMRVSLELEHEGAALAEVADISDEGVAMRLIEEPPEALSAGDRVLLVFPVSTGLCQLPATLESLAGADVRIRLTGGETVLQRRAEARHAVDRPATVRRASDEPDAGKAAVIVDASRGGLRLRAPLQASIGDRLLVEVESAGGAAVEGRVVMATPSSPGEWALNLAFTDPTRARQLLGDLLPG